MNKSELTTAIRRGLGIGGGAVLLSISPMVLADSTFGAVVELSELDGTQGFVINGIDASDYSGRSVSGAGDINGDGISDLIIGAFRADPNGNFRAGESYVIFGGSGVGSSGTFELSALDGINGFVLNGIDMNDSSGISVSDAGDINGDGMSDLIIGAYRGGPNGNGNLRAGESYIVFGGSGVGISGTFELSTLDGSNGFVLNGIGTDDLSGRSVSDAGDINGDGISDLIIGAFLANPNGLPDAGESYVIFGGSGVGSNGAFELSTLDGINGFVLSGIDVADASSRSVNDAGDINGDGVSDLIIGANSANPNGNSRAGESYVVFGSNGIGSGGTFELSELDGSNGFVLNGIDAGDFSGISVSDAGDINGDGISDLIIGANDSDPNGNLSAGESYVVFGGNGVGSSGTFELSALDGSNGFVLNGIDAFDRSGRSVSDAGDINGDGVSDLIIGAYDADPNGIDRAGESYVVFGGSGVGSSGTFELSELDGSNGFVLNGIDASDFSGGSVSSAGDINGDGISDLIIGASDSDPNGNSGAGESYVIFGKNVPICNGRFVTVDLNFGEIPGPNDDVVLGTSGSDDIRGRSGNDTICGEGGNDFIHGNSGDDWIDGGNGVDNIRGGQGNDELHAGTGATVGTTSIVFGGIGDDEIHGGPDADDLRGGGGVDRINGNAGNDEITGNSDNDVISGGGGDDELRGGQGDDQLMGDGGDDFLSGGGGLADICDGSSGVDIATPSCEMVINIP